MNRKLVVTAAAAALAFAPAATASASSLGGALNLNIFGNQVTAQAKADACVGKIGTIVEVQGTGSGEGVKIQCPSLEDIAKNIGPVEVSGGFNLFGLGSSAGGKADANGAGAGSAASDSLGGQAEVKGNTGSLSGLSLGLS